MRNKKLKDLLNFTVQSVDEMQKDDNFSEWSAEDIFELATEVALNEYSAKGTKQPIARVDSDRFAFCFNELDSESEVIIIHGEDLFDD